MLLLGAAALAAGCSAEAPARPSVILISLDTLRADHLSLYGYERDTTPRLDELAGESVVYDRAYTTASFTLIAHMSMLTGLYPREHGVLEDGQALSPAVPSLAERLSEAGYHTMGVYRSGWIHERFGFGRGFDTFVARPNAFKAAEAVEKALDDRPSDRPFFLFVHLFDAHCSNLKRPGSTIYEPPPEFADAFVPGAADELREPSAYDLYYGQLEASPQQAEAIRALYDSGVRFLDDLVGGWIDEWRADGLLDDTLLIVTSDHGEALGLREDRFHGHGGFYEDGLRIPLLIRFPDGRWAGERRSELVSLVDLVPTVLEFLDLPAHTWLSGRSLLGEPDADRVVIAERTLARTVIGSRWKLFSASTEASERLYDLEADPGEREPFSKGNARRPDAKDVRNRMVERAAELDAGPAPPGSAVTADAASDDERAELDAIGYGGGDE